MMFNLKYISTVLRKLRERMRGEKVILVDERDREIGIADKLSAHREGMLHRAFSIFIFNEEGDMLLQQRAPEKYHSGGLWSNTCCSHPRPGERIEEAAERRLYEEMGIHCPLQKAFDFIYQASLDNRLMEHEYDHVFIGRHEGEVYSNPKEVQNYRWVSVEELQNELLRCPKRFTIWFRIAVTEVLRRRPHLNLQSA